MAKKYTEIELVIMTFSDDVIMVSSTNGENFASAPGDWYKEGNFSD